MIKVLVFAFAALMALDAVQTYFFPRFGLREGNAWLAKLLSQEGIDELFFVKYIVFFMVLAGAGEGVLPLWALFLILAMQGGVVIWNFYKMLSNRKANP